MNSQYANQKISQGAPTSLYGQANIQNVHYSYESQSATGKGFVQTSHESNGPSINYLEHTQNQAYQMQPAISPNNGHTNQVCQDLNAMHLSQNHTCPPVMNNHLLPRFEVPSMQPPGTVYTPRQQNIYATTSQKQMSDTGMRFPKPVSSGGLHHPYQNNAYGSSTVPLQQNSLALPSQNTHSSTFAPPQHVPNSLNLVSQHINSHANSAIPHGNTYSSMQQNSAYSSMPIPQTSQSNYSPIMPSPMENNYSSLPPSGRNLHDPIGHEAYSAPQDQQQFNRNHSSYANGVDNSLPPLAPLPSQPIFNQGSNMHARYPPSSLSPGSSHPPNSLSSQQCNSSYSSQQNHMGSLPAPPASSKRLDPDQIPSLIQVVEDDKKLRSTNFVTSQRGLVPPLVTTDFVVIDQGNCNPRFIRSTIYSVPTTADVLKQTYVPFALAISPFAELKGNEQPPPIVDPGEDGPVRCHRCRAYMSPFMQFIDAGRRFQCMLCKTTTEVPAHYFTHLDHVGQRADKFERPELCLGSYEFIVNKDYCKEEKFPNLPAYIFLIDVSYNSIRSGMVKTLCDNMKSILNNLPREDNCKESKLRVGFVTYSSVVHFYNINSNLAQPQMLVVSDISDMFMPLLDGFLVVPAEATAVIDSLMEQIPSMFAETRETETVLGPAIQAGLEALKAAECSGKLLVFHSALPIAEAPGKLKNRDDRKLLGTEKEKAILSPQSTFYNNLGQECVKAGCSVDLFLFNNAYIDVATIGQICRLSGGQLYKYTYFQSDIDGSRFLEDVRNNVKKFRAFDAILRVRTSTGIRPIDFNGCFFMSNTTDVELASVSSDTSLTIEIKYDDKLPDVEGVCIQCAVLYTSCSGQRRLRVHNLALNSCTQMADIFRTCELDTILNFFLKDGVRRVTEETPKQIKEFYISCSAQILACYRKNCAQASPTGQLILPECMKLLPLYVNCLLKSDAISGGQEMNVDDRSFIMLAVLSMNVDSTAAYLYPRLLPLHETKPDLENFELPVAIRCSFGRLKENGVYLIENGLNMFLWIGLSADPEWVKDVFDVSTVSRIDVEKNHLLLLNNPLSQWVRIVIDCIQSQRQRHLKLHIVRQGDRAELLFRLLLVEDRTTEGSESYVDYLCHLHKEIRNLLS